MGLDDFDLRALLFPRRDLDLRDFELDRKWRVIWYCSALATSIEYEFAASDEVVGVEEAAAERRNSDKKSR